MRYILIFLAFLVSCASVLDSEEPVIEPPELPNSQSIVVKGVAGSTVETDTLFSFLLEPTILEQGSEAPTPGIEKNWGIHIIVTEPVFKSWVEAHGLVVYAALESREAKPDTIGWFLTEVRSLGYKP